MDDPAITLRPLIDPISTDRGIFASSWSSCTAPGFSFEHTVPTHGEFDHNVPRCGRSNVYVRLLYNRIVCCLLFLPLIESILMHEMGLVIS